MQFSLRSIFLVTIAVAVVCGILRSLTEDDPKLVYLAIMVPVATWGLGAVGTIGMAALGAAVGEWRGAVTGAALGGLMWLATLAFFEGLNPERKQLHPPLPASIVVILTVSASVICVLLRDLRVSDTAADPEDPGTTRRLRESQLERTKPKPPTGI